MGSGHPVVAPPPIRPLPPADEAPLPARATRRAGSPPPTGARAKPLGVDVLDLGEVCEPTPEDGIHFEADAHRAIAHAVAEPVRALFA
jgi:lysophospholipase L1-like esterase